MAIDERPAAQAHPAKQGSIGKFLNFIFKVMGILIFSALMSVIIEWIGMNFYYPEEGFRHAEEMMIREMEYFTGVDHKKAYSDVGLGNLNKGSVNMQYLPM